MNTEFVSSLSYFSSQSNSRSKEGDGGAQQLHSFAKNARGKRQSERLRERQTLRGGTFLPNSFRLIFAQGRISHYILSPRQQSPSCKMTGSLANFLLMTQNCLSDDESSGHLNSCQIARFQFWTGWVSLGGFWVHFFWSSIMASYEANKKMRPRKGLVKTSRNVAVTDDPGKRM